MKQISPICADCKRQVDNPPAHLTSETPGRDGVFLAWCAGCYYRNRSDSQVTMNYPCGCSATGGVGLPTYCPEHDPKGSIG